jgi:WW domain-binding protein 2
MKLKDAFARKNSWVMLAPSGEYTPLPGETTVYTSPPRTFLHVKSPSGYPGSQPYDLQSGPGKAYLTTRRVWNTMFVLYGVR